MFKNIKYYKDFDSLYFESDNLGECEFHKDGDLEIEQECCCGSTQYIFINISELRELVNLYDSRKTEP